jgi:hypothetical protein
MLRPCKTTNILHSNLGVPKDMAEDSKKLKFGQFTLWCKQGVHFLSIWGRLLVKDKEQVQKAHFSNM